MKRAAAWLFRTTVRIPAIWIALLAVSALIGNAAQWLERDSLRIENASNNAESECRSRINGYVEGLSIELSVAEAFGLLDATGSEDLPISRQEAVKRATDAASRLEVARSYRERAVEVCAENPHFNPQTDIHI